MCQRRKESKAKRYIRLCRGNLNLGCRILLPKPFILYCQNQTLIYQSSAETKRTEKTLRTDQCTIASGKIQSIWAEPVSSDVYDQKIWMTYLEEVHTHTHTHSSLKQCQQPVWDESTFKPNGSFCAFDPADMSASGSWKAETWVEKPKRSQWIKGLDQKEDRRGGCAGEQQGKGRADLCSFQCPEVLLKRSMNEHQRTSLVAQWLRCHPSTAGRTGSIPHQGTKIPHASQPNKTEEE